MVARPGVNSDTDNFSGRRGPALGLRPAVPRRSFQRRKYGYTATSTSRLAKEKKKGKMSKTGSLQSNASSGKPVARRPPSTVQEDLVPGSVARQQHKLFDRNFHRNFAPGQFRLAARGWAAGVEGGAIFQPRLGCRPRGPLRCYRLFEQTGSGIRKGVSNTRVLINVTWRDPRARATSVQHREPPTRRLLISWWVCSRAQTGRGPGGGGGY